MCPWLNPNVLVMDLLLQVASGSCGHCNCSSEFLFDFRRLEMSLWTLLKQQLDKPLIWGLILSSQYSPNQKTFTPPAFERLAADGGQLVETLRQGTVLKFSSCPHNSERIWTTYRGADIALTARRFSTQG